MRTGVPYDLGIPNLADNVSDCLEKLTCLIKAGLGAVVDKLAAALHGSPLELLHHLAGVAPRLGPHVVDDAAGCLDPPGAVRGDAVKVLAEHADDVAVQAAAGAARSHAQQHTGRILLQISRVVDVSPKRLFERPNLVPMVIDERFKLFDELA